VGVDYSAEAISAAQQLATDIGYTNPASCRFIRHDVLTLMECKELQDEKFDIVITNEGVLCWLSDLPQWGRVVAHFMKPDTGIFYIFEYHCFSNIFGDENEAEDSEDEGEIAIMYPYFPDDKGTPVEHDSPGTYTESEGVLKNRREFEWPHTFGDVLNSLLTVGLSLEFVHEFPFSTYYQLPGLEKGQDDLYRFKAERYSRTIPLMFSLLATNVRRRNN